MGRILGSGLVALAIVVCVALGQQPGAKTHEVRLNGHTFTLPVGFEIEVAAGPPLGGIRRGH